MTEQDNIKELFSRSLENHSRPVRPEVWQGLQAKMAAAGVASSSVAATKGISALTKWILGGAAVTGTAVITTVALMHQSGETPVNAPQKTISRNTELIETPQNEAAPNVADVKIETKVLSQKAPVTIELSHRTALIPASDPVQSEVSPGSNSFLGITNPDVLKTTPISDEKKEEIIQREKQQPVIIETQVAPTSGETTASAVEPASVEFFPNIFSPNGDGVNDFYELKFHHVESVQISIIDSRNNNVVFESQNPEFKWYGNILETTDQAPDGLYACLIRYKDQQGKTYKKTQIIEIKR